jgi:hypothetical protein
VERQLQDLNDILYFAKDVAKVTKIEGFATDGALHHLQQASPILTLDGRWRHGL